MELSNANTPSARIQAVFCSRSRALCLVYYCNERNPRYYCVLQPVTSIPRKLYEGMNVSDRMEAACS